MNPYLQAMLRLAHAQQDSPGGDQVIRPGGPPMGALIDPGIYGPPGGLGGLGGGNPVMSPKPSSAPEWREMGGAQHMLRGLQQGQDVNLTGTGFEMTPAQIAGAPSSLDMLQQYLRQPQSPGNMLQGLNGMNW